MRFDDDFLWIFVILGCFGVPISRPFGINSRKKIGLKKTYSQKEITIINDYSGPAYGLPSRKTIKAIKYVAEKEGMITDPVYEGKSMQGLIDLAKKQFFPEGSKILYAHLGGAPALNGYSYYYKDG